MNKKEERFCYEYVKDFKKIPAAVRSGVPVENAKRFADKLCKRADCVELMSALHNEALEKCVIDADFVKNRLYEETVADIADLFDETTGALLPIHEWPLIWRQGLVASVEVEQKYQSIAGRRMPDGIVAKIKFANRNERLKLLGQHVDVKAFSEGLQITTLERVVALMGSGRERVKQLQEQRQQRESRVIDGESVKVDA